MLSSAMRKGSDKDRHHHFGVEGELLLYLFIVICILY